MSRVLGIFLVALSSLGASVMSEAAEIHVFCPGAVRAVVTDLAKDFFGETGHQVIFIFGTAGALQAKAAGGESGDVVMVTSKALEELEKRGVVVPGTRSDLGSVGVGVAVKSGAPLPAISTPEALRNTLLTVRSFSFADPAKGGQSGIHFSKVLEQLGIAEEVKKKVVLFPAGTMGLQKVALGEIELGIGQMSEIAEVPGVKTVGPLPDPLQNKLTFSAGILAKAKSQDAARSFIRFLTNPSSRAKFRAGGFESPD